MKKQRSCHFLEKPENQLSLGRFYIARVLSYQSQIVAMQSR